MKATSLHESNMKKGYSTFYIFYPFLKKKVDLMETSILTLPYEISHLHNLFQTTISGSLLFPSTPLMVLLDTPSSPESQMD